jgi:hypothetical protein
MQSADDSSPSKNKASRSKPKRSMGKGTPPPRNDTLVALGGPESMPNARKPNEDVKRPKLSSKKRTISLKFRVRAKFRRAFRRAASAQDCKKVELLERIFTEWSGRNPA